MHGIDTVGYWLWGTGTVLLAIVAGWTYLEYRLGAGRTQAEIARRSGQVAEDARRERAGR
jgi:hypothetical protein